MHEEMIKKFEEIAEKCMEEIKGCKSIEEVCKILMDNGMDAPAEEIKEMLIELADYVREDEMIEDEEEMDQISGTWKYFGKMTRVTWEVGIWIANMRPWPGQNPAKKKIMKYWGIG